MTRWSLWQCAQKRHADWTEAPADLEGGSAMIRLLWVWVRSGPDRRQVHLAIEASVKLVMKPGELHVSKAQSSVSPSVALGSASAVDNVGATK